MLKSHSHHLHDTLSEKAPPIKGPITDAKLYAIPSTPVNAARCLGGQAAAMTMGPLATDGGGFERRIWSAVPVSSGTVHQII